MCGLFNLDNSRSLLNAPKKTATDESCINCVLYKLQWQRSSAHSKHTRLEVEQYVEGWTHTRQRPNYQQKSPELNPLSNKSGDSETYLLHIAQRFAMRKYVYNVARNQKKLKGYDATLHRGSEGFFSRSVRGALALCERPVTWCSDARPGSRHALIRRGLI